MRTSCGSVTEAIGPSPTFSPSRRQTKSSAMRKISSNLWLMKTMARPSALSCATMRNRSSISLADKRRRRLVHDDDLRLVRQRAGDLDQVLLRDGQALQLEVGRDGGIDALQQCGRRFAHLSPVDEARPPSACGP